MQKTKAKNENLKRKYFKWLQEAQGYSDATIEAIEKAIWNYEDFTKDSDYAEFNDKVAKDFKKWLSNKKHGDKEMSLSTQYTRLRHLNKFFTWVSGQSGYKSKISIYDVSYLKLSKKESKIATSPKVLDYPSIEYVKKLCGSINADNEVASRDRALIAFTLLSGMRDKAITTLPMGCFKPDELQIIQDPKQGVQTKFSKQIVTTLFGFDDDLIKYVLDWYEYLKSEKLYGTADPIFPRTKVEQGSKENRAFVAKGVEPVFWKSVSALRKIFKERATKGSLDYYSPHKFRHTATRIATDHCRNAEQIKAVSQNLGHEHVGTTLTTYGRLSFGRVGEVVSGLSFKKSGKEKTLSDMKKLVAKMESYED